MSPNSKAFTLVLVSVCQLYMGSCHYKAGGETKIAQCISLILLCLGLVIKVLPGSEFHLPSGTGGEGGEEHHLHYMKTP